MIDTHTHMDGTEFDEDRDQAVERARQAGVSRLFLPAINLASIDTVLAMVRRYPGFAYPMIGLHPEEVNGDWRETLAKMHARRTAQQDVPAEERFIAIGEVGLDYYWSREFEKEQLAAFEKQVEWSVETRLPLMIHCRKAQNEMVKILRGYRDELPGGVFHCFTGNLHEAEELLEFPRFALGIGGVLTFKKSHLPEVLPHVPLDRVVLETDSPYMAPVPNRGKRNESAYVALVMERMAECYGVTPAEVERQTDANAERLFPLAFT